MHPDVTRTPVSFVYEPGFSGFTVVLGPSLLVYSSLGLLLSEGLSCTRFNGPILDFSVCVSDSSKGPEKNR